MSKGSRGISRLKSVQDSHLKVIEGDFTVVRVSLSVWHGRGCSSSRIGSHPHRQRVDFDGVFYSASKPSGKNLHLRCIYDVDLHGGIG